MLTPAQAQSLYHKLGAAYDLAEAYERQAKLRATELLQVRPGLRVLNVGTGTGRDQVRLAAAVAPASATAIDIAPAMLRLTRQRAAGWLAQADVCRLPFAQAAFDRIFCAYLLDLLPEPAMGLALSEFRRVLRPGGRLVLVSLTAGVSPASRAVIAAWCWLYARNPLLVGGCRPVQLADSVTASGLVLLTREVLVQRGVPSEVLLAEC